MITGEIYWTDTAEDIIHKATPDGKSISAVITNGLHTADGIVIDSTGRKVNKNTTKTTLKSNLHMTFITMK